MCNYPTGAAHDPEAPYNKEPQERMNVTVKACMFKDVDIPVPPDMRSTFVNQALIKEKRTSVDNVYLPRLLDDCKNWQLDHYTVEV